MSRCLLLFIGCVVSATGWSHDVGVINLHIIQQSPNDFLFQTAHGVDYPPPIFISACELAQEISLSSRFLVRCESGSGLKAILGWQAGGIWLTVSPLGGADIKQLVMPSNHGFTINLNESQAINTGWHFINLGFEHILAGLDHLLLVVGLLMLVNALGSLVVAITSFTLAHSLTLVLSYLNVIALPMAAVEACIALSIAVLAVEVVGKLRGKWSWAQQYPALIAGLFGLLHGLGFASALKELNVPLEDRPMSLLGFNVGVELGQLVFLSALLVGVLLGKKLIQFGITPSYQAILSCRVIWLAAYGMGSLAMYWTLSRLF